MISLKLSLKKWLLIAAGVLVVLVIVLATVIYVRARHSEERFREFVVEQLSDRFQSDVELKALHVKVFPRIGVEGEDLQLHRKNSPIPQPLIRIGRFYFAVNILGLLRPIKHIPLVQIDDMVITMPPRSQQGDQSQNQEPSNNKAKVKGKPRVVVDKIVCKDTDILIMPAQANKVPLDWDIHDLVLYSVGPNQPAPFKGTLTNGKPKGEIATHGLFGPWDANDPGNTPVSGQYEFSDADLGPFPGIAGTLSSTGKYSGVLSELEVDGKTDTPNFSLDKVGKPVSLHTDFWATVDGTNGDTILHPVNGTLANTFMIVNGKVEGIPQKGHLIVTDVSVPNGRIQDILSLAMNSTRPLMSGPVKIKAKLIIPPGKENTLDKMILDGQFGVEDATWSNPELRERLKSLSRAAEGKPGDEDAGSAVSDLKGSFHLEKGVINFHNLTFSVEGADISLAGTYDLRGGELDMKGTLRLQAKISQTVTGVKSFFLKAVDPFLSKNGAGTELPLTITGTRDKPVFGVSVFHKTIKKGLGDSKDSDQSSPNRR
jgi:hypothetical protein